MTFARAASRRKGRRARDIGIAFLLGGVPVAWGLVPSAVGSDASAARSARGVTIVTVNAIAPGSIATEGTSQTVTGLTKEQTDAMMAAFTQRIPMKRMGVPDDIAKVAVFLASSAADYMTGALIVVDGGMLLS
jgi:NAD(P)-dependent dehydrogenase (short-subunit alcohol dehydrogenase family)